MMRFLLTCVLMLVPFSASAQASLFDVDDPESYVLRIQPRVWFSQNKEFDGKVTDTLSSGSTSVVEWDTDLDDQTRFTPFIELKLGERHKLRASFFRVDRSEVVPSTDITVRVGGTEIPQPAGAFTDGKIDLDVYQIGYQYDLFKVGEGFIGGLIDVAIADYEASAVAQYDSTGDGNVDTVTTVRDDEILPIPQVGLAWRLYPLRRVAIQGEVEGMTIGNKGSVVQVIGGLEFQVQQHLALEAGYRYLYVDFDINDIETTYKDIGPYIGTVLRF